MTAWISAVDILLNISFFSLSAWWKFWDSNNFLLFLPFLFYYELYRNMRISGTSRVSIRLTCHDEKPRIYIFDPLKCLKNTFSNRICNFFIIHIHFKRLGNICKFYLHFYDLWVIRASMSKFPGRYQQIQGTLASKLQASNFRSLKIEFINQGIRRFLEQNLQDIFAPKPIFKINFCCVSIQQGSICRGWPRVVSLFDFANFGRFVSLCDKDRRKS